MPLNPTPKDIDRFMSKVDQHGPVHPYSEDKGRCWIYLGGKLQGREYGRFSIGRKTVYAHRFSYFVKNGKLPDNCACHSCDRGWCVNPDHLFDGTHKENADDRDSKGRGAKGERGGTAKLSSEDVAYIRSMTGLVKQRDLASKFGVSRGNIGHIQRYMNWKSPDSNAGPPCPCSSRQALSTSYRLNDNSDARLA